MFPDMKKKHFKELFFNYGIKIIQGIIILGKNIILPRITGAG